MKKLFLTTALAIPLGAGLGWAQTTPAPDAVTAPATEAPAATDMTAAPVSVPADVMQQQAPNELRVDWITGTTVKSTDGESVGTVQDVIVDGDTGQMKAAIVGVGGFLGIGEKQIAIDWAKLQVNYDANEITTAITKEEAQAAPGYEFREQAAAPAPVAEPAAAATDAPATAPTPATTPADAAGAAANDAAAAATDAAGAATDATGDAARAATDAAGASADAAGTAAKDAAGSAVDAAGAAVDAAGDAAGAAVDSVTGATPPVTTPPAN